VIDIFSWAIIGLLPVIVGIKWLRVAQREHYIAGWTTRIALGWGRSRQVSWWPLIAAVALEFLSSTISTASWWISLVVPTVVFALVLWWPWGLRFRGTSSPLQWTARVQRLAAVWLVLSWLFLFTASSLSLSYAVVLFGFVAPGVMDLALLIARPIEKALSKKWLVAAQKKLRHVNPTVVALTGSYGKTSTKGYVAHLVAAKYSVVPSPASFNNLMGLARAVNDKLTPGTEVFVAEMGVYGEGEIRELSKSFPPDIAAITTIGEAHLERMGTRDAILRAKSEIVENAQTVVLPIDDPDLAALADRCERDGKRVIRVSAAGAKADVSVNPAKGSVAIGAESVPVLISGVGHAVNVAVAVGIAHALDVPLAVLAPRLGNLPTAAHRAEPQQAPSGAIIIDDSYNANPIGAARAIDGGAAMAKARKGPFIVVTPGMIELGAVQVDRNLALSAQVAKVRGELFVVGYTNRAALVAGHPTAQVFADRPTAMAAALERAGASGVILVENDLPDHYA
jgi:UDP-N-acetylmuramoyl-tripeptide--D-alanyl-D-alanine ligase